MMKPRFLLAIPALMASIAPVYAAQSITIHNQLPASPICTNGNTVSVFAPNQQVIPTGGKIIVNGDYSKFPGIGIQVNNWYWTPNKLPVQKSSPQNPDNSGAQFTISNDCVISQSPPVYGDGVPTYLIANVSAKKTSTGCEITIKSNSNTNAVTPGCCSPPGIGDKTCTGPWGVTNDGKAWPPS